MNNIISPIISGEIKPNVPSPENGTLSGAIKLPSQSLGALNVNDVLTLQFINTLSATEGSTQNPTQSTFSKILLTMPDKTEIELPLNENIKLPQAVNDTGQVLSVKVTSIKNGEINFQVSSMNPERLETTEKAPTSQPQTSSKAEPPITTEIKENIRLPLAPLKLSNVVSTLAKELKLPPTTTEQIIKALPEVEINFSQTVNKAETLSPQQFTNLLTQIKNTLSTPIPPEQISKQITTLLNNMETLPATTDKYPLTTIFKTPLGNVFPEEKIDLPTGIKMLLNISEINFKDKTPDLKEILSVLQPKDDFPTQNMKSIPPETQKALVKILQATPLIENKIPQEPSAKNFMSNVLGFIKAVKQQDISAWLGKAETAELRATPQGQNILNTAQVVVDSSHREVGRWQLIEIPLASGELSENIRLAIKQQEEEESEKKQQNITRRKQTRFIMETTFSQLGSFQFDGLAVEEQRRFDLIIRTEKTLPDDIYTHIMRLYMTTLQKFDYHGTIKINLKENFIKPWEDDTTENLGQGIFV